MAQTHEYVEQRMIGAPTTTTPQLPPAGVLRLSWSAIFGGAVAALGIWALLYALGLALGLSSMDPSNPDSARPWGIFTGIWSVIAPLVALFVGGFVAGRGSGSPSKGLGGLHGLVMWGLTVVAGIWLIGTVASRMISGAVALGSGAAEAGRGAITGMVGPMGKGADVLGLGSEDFMGPINQRLREQGKPELGAGELQAAASDALRDGLRQGRLDRAVIVQSLAEHTKLSRADAEQVAAGIEQRFETRMDRAGDQLSSTALTAADRTGKALWGVFAALLLGLIAAIGGSLFGASRLRRSWFKRQTPPTSERYEHRQYDLPYTEPHGRPAT